MGGIVSSGISGLFQLILSLSLVGTYVILLVLLVRVFFQKAPRWCSYLLWAIVFIRLVCPVFPEAGFSLIPEGLIWETGAGEVADKSGEETEGAMNMEDASGFEDGAGTESSMLERTSGADIVGNVPEDSQQAIGTDTNLSGLHGATDAYEELNIQEEFSGQEESAMPEGSHMHKGADDTDKLFLSTMYGILEADSLLLAEGDTLNGGNFAGMAVNGILLKVLSYIWLVGTLCLAGYHTFSYWKLKIKVKHAKETEPGVREIQGEHLSFVMGIFKPGIYLSAGLDAESRRVVLCHERVHLRRKDYLTKPAALAICCVHWFNPLVWLAFYLMNKDCEMSCDEKVVRILGEESKKIYSYALLDEATKGERKFYKRGTVCALLSFGEDHVKNRISHVLKYKKASLRIVVAAVVALVVLVVGLCSNPGEKAGNESLTEEKALELVEAAREEVQNTGAIDNSGKADDENDEGIVYACFLADYDGDGKEEAFVEIGKPEGDAAQIYGELWFVSEDGEVELLLENKYFYRNQESFYADKEEFKLFSYLEEDDTQASLHTAVYGVRQGKAEKMLSNQYRKYVDGETIVCMVEDYKTEYDVREQVFSGYDQKKYTYYYDGYYIKPHSGYSLDREELEAYENGEAILQNLEAKYPQARFEYIFLENDLVHVNIAYEEQDTIQFRYITYNGESGSLLEVEEGVGCYKAKLEAAGGISFAEQIAKEYGWQTDNALATSQMSAESALDRFAWGFADRDGDALYQLSFDKENFENWDMVIPLEDGGYAFGDSSPWPAGYAYEIDYTEGAEEATIRFIMSNSAPEHYIALEKVKLTKQGELIFVDHVDFKMYSNIENRDELAQIYDLEADIPFPSTETGYYNSFGRIILQHILKETNPEYYAIYTDPVSSAKAMLHLGDGAGEVTELLYEAPPQYFPGRTEPGEGSIVNVRYTFAKDNSTVDIPMVLADESENIWVLSCGDYALANEYGYAEGPLHNDNAREVYGEYFWDDRSRPELEGVSTSFADKYPTCQISSYGVYCLDGSGIHCIYPYKIMEDGADVAAFNDGKVYFPTDSKYYEGALDWMYDSICILDIRTGEYTYIPLSTEAQSIFPLSGIRVEDEVIYLHGNGNTGNTFVLMLSESSAVPWREKPVSELTADERAVIGVANRKYILEHPGRVVAVGNRTEEETFALVDMDGDGDTEEITVGPASEESELWSGWDEYKISCEEGFEFRSAENLENQIFAFSPDGERIFIALYEDGPSGDPLTTLFKYEYNRLQYAGEFANDIRQAVIEKGVIYTNIRNWVMQTDSIAVQYRMNESGDLEEIFQEIYYYGVKRGADSPVELWDWTGDSPITLKVELPLHTEPESEETFILEPQEVRFVAVHHSMGWVLVQTTGGQSLQGWVHVVNGEIVDLQMDNREVFDGLSFAG